MDKAEHRALGGRAGRRRDLCGLAPVPYTAGDNPDSITFVSTDSDMNGNPHANWFL
ncbi:hypothetical protein IBTHAUMO2_90002 [Nitrosopumilaceae archaeon]|nr:hypothetical protein IBTHAUMO2_90002 [Nitrosopumilaceae archaeon]